MAVSSWTIEWSDELSMSHPEIDAEHQQFIKIVNALNDEIMCKHRGDKEAVEHLLCLLLEDARAHFLNEERLFSEKAYVHAEEHVRIHSELIKTFEQALKTIQGTEIKALWIKMGLSIKDQLIDHFLEEDAKYIECLKAE